MGGWIPNKNDPYDNSGEGNMGACCAEMDLWEANKVATAFTPHPATIEGLHVCMGDEECGSQDGDRFIAPTDRDGCDINAFRMGDQNFYGEGPQFQVNTQRPFKVVTRFHAPAGELTAIEQFYIQDGKEIHHPNYSVGGNDNVESDAFCAAQKTSFGDRNSFAEKGGMKAMGEALDRGMVLVVSLWDDVAVNMNWLDSVMEGDDPSAPGAKRGPCDPADGKPATLREAHPDAHYIVTDVKWGDIGTTTNASPGPAPTPTPTPPSPTPTPTPTPSPSPGGCPGGSLSACIDLCPADVFAACVESCQKRCSSVVV